MRKCVIFKTWLQETESIFLATKDDTLSFSLQPFFPSDGVSTQQLGFRSEYLKGQNVREY